MSRILALLMAAVALAASGCDPNPGGPSAPDVPAAGADTQSASTKPGVVKKKSRGPQQGPAPAGLQ